MALRIWNGASLIPGTGGSPPPAATTHLIGIYDGTYHNTNNPDPDLTTLGRFGALPPIASSYYNGNQLPQLDFESTRLSRGTHAVLDCSMKFPSGFGGTVVTFDDVANQTVDGLAWVDARVARFHALSQVNPVAKVYVSLEQEWEIKKQRDTDGGNAYLVPISAAAALDVFHTRMHAGAPTVITNYWTSGSIHTTSDRNYILAVLAAMQVAPKIVTIDPYRGPGRPSHETFFQSANDKIQWYRDNADFQRLGSPQMGIAEVGTDRSHGDASVATFINSIRPGLVALDLPFALWFNRDSGPNNNCQLHNMGMPQSVAALAAQFTAHE